MKINNTSSEFRITAEVLKQKRIKFYESLKNDAAEFDNFAVKIESALAYYLILGDIRNQGHDFKKKVEYEIQRILSCDEFLQ